MASAYEATGDPGDSSEFYKRWEDLATTLGFADTQELITYMKSPLFLTHWRTPMAMVF